MKVLVPLLSKKEHSPEFLEKATKKAKEIILLLVIDTAAMSGQFGFATNEIKEGTELMEAVKALVGKKRKTCKDVMEWGGTLTKIEHTAELLEVDKILLVKQDNYFFKKLLSSLKEKTGKEIEVVKVKEEV